MQRIVFLERDTLAPAVRVRRPDFAHDWEEYPKTRADQVIERAKGASILIVNKVNIGADTFAALPDLKLIAMAATGTDCIDKQAAAAHGVAVANIRGYATTTVPEHTFALILALARSIVPYRADVLGGGWQQAEQFSYFTYPITDLAGRRLAVFGSGSLGGRVAELGRAFGMDVVFVGRKGARDGGPGRVSFDEAIETADVLTFHCPLTAETRGLVAMPEFRRMKRRPIVVNTARGGLVDEVDLERALDEGLVSAAGLDVTLPEPPPMDAPIMRLAQRPNVIVTPHTAWASIEAQQVLADQMIDNIEAFVAGNPRNLVVG
ncbi:D-2-hydroxyacid dehydrogenase [Pinisolibacter sp.]|uniref:D-2-hydroxyacid dehydrogenase n=1 Tax=Pinisolibacter sp. TaxID=2172024 RepID=UPI002FDCEAB3